MRKIRNRNLFRREWFLFFSASNEQSALPAAVVLAFAETDKGICRTIGFCRKTGQTVVLYIYQEYLIVDKGRVLHRDGIEYQNEKDVREEL